MGPLSPAPPPRKLNSVTSGKHYAVMFDRGWKTMIRSRLSYLKQKLNLNKIVTIINYAICYNIYFGPLP